MTHSHYLGCLLIFTACGAKPTIEPWQASGPVRINEVVPRNGGVWVDESGQTADLIELINIADKELSLKNYELRDSTGATHLFNSGILAPGAHLILWADNDLSAGPTHLPFKLDADNDALLLIDPGGSLVDRVQWKDMLNNESLSRFPDGDGGFAVCLWASPSRNNGESCAPPAAPSLGTEIEYTEYLWPSVWPEESQPLVLNELALRPANFIEVVNTSSSTVDLSLYELRLSPHGPGLPWPSTLDGVALSWPQDVLVAGERLVIALSPSDTTQLEATADFEGVVSIFDLNTSLVVDRVDFIAWPNTAALARFPDRHGAPFFCSESTPGSPNTCSVVHSRPVGNRLRALRTPGDFSALSLGDVSLGSRSVKFVVDMEAGDVVFFLDSQTWDLHYTFIREEIDLLTHLDRCDPLQNQQFYDGWVQFSAEQYFAVEGRRYLLGTLTEHAGSSLHTVEFAPGDRISAAQMQRAFWTVIRHLNNPTDWALRPQSPDQVATMQNIDGLLPIVSQNAPFEEVVYQPLTPGVGYGVLTFVDHKNLASSVLGLQTLLVTDEVPNDLPFVGGLITSAFQTPLSHVNILSRARGTPNMALPEVQQNSRLTPYWGQLVRLEVGAADFSISLADATEAQNFWDNLKPSGPKIAAPQNLAPRGPQMLANFGLTDIDFLGGKAAQLAELLSINSNRNACFGPIPTPQTPFAIPLVHFVEHLQASGCALRLQNLLQDPAFLSDPNTRASGLRELQDLILNHPVDPVLLSGVEQLIATLFGTQRIRFRSSSNTEDLPGFNGAGLYTSTSGALDDANLPIEDAIRTVWASLYETRAYDERDFYNIDQETAAMAILVHPAFLSEKANGVVISRNILEPIRSDIFYFNSQTGEASVTNPAPGVFSEQSLYHLFRAPHLEYVQRSSLSGENTVLSASEADRLACAVDVIHDHFRPLIDPLGANRWFAMDIEFKLVGTNRDLVIKQARPYSFGTTPLPTDCREF